MKITCKELSRDDSAILKGIGILMIMIHNFMHLFPAPKENEFEFSAVPFQQFLTGLVDGPENITQLAFSYFGRYPS